MKILNILTERNIGKTDPAMDDYYDEKDAEQANVKDAPYAVGWDGQYHEWYGDEGPETGKGRYKPKPGGAGFAAINVPTYEMAEKIAADLEEKLKQEEGGEWGKDWGVVDVGDVWIRPMSSLDEWDQDEIKSTLRYEPHKIKDYGNADV